MLAFLDGIDNLDTLKAPPFSGIFKVGKILWAHYVSKCKYYCMYTEQILQVSCSTTAQRVRNVATTLHLRFFAYIQYSCTHTFRPSVIVRSPSKVWYFIFQSPTHSPVVSGAYMYSTAMQAIPCWVEVGSSWLASLYVNSVQANHHILVTYMYTS